MKTTLYLATAEGLCIVIGSNGNWHGDVRLAGKHVQCVAASSRHPEIVFSGTFGDGIFRSDDGGMTWQSCGGFPLDKVMSLALGESEGPGASGVVYAGTEPSALFQSGDRGETWSELPSFLNLPSAKQWSFPPRPQTHHVRYILPDPYVPRRLHLAIEAGALLRGEEGGQTWRDRVSGSPRDTHTLAVHRSAPGRLYSAAGDGYFESLDDGDTWRRIVDGLQHQYCWSVAVSLADPDTVLLTATRNAYEAHRKESANSFVYRRIRGEPWREVREGLPASQGRRVAVVAASEIEPDVFYLSAEGDVYRSADRGGRWEPLAVQWEQNTRPAHAVALAITEASQ